MFMTLLLVAGNETTRNALSGRHGRVRAFRRSGRSAREPRSCRLRGRGDPALRDAGRGLPAAPRPATPDRRPQDREGRQGRDDLPGGEPRPRGLRRPGDVPHRPHAERPPAFGIGRTSAWRETSRGREIRIVFRELLRRLPDIRVAPGEGPCVPSPLVAAIASLPVVFTPQDGVRDRPAAFRARLQSSTLRRFAFSLVGRDTRRACELSFRC